MMEIFSDFTVIEYISFALIACGAVFFWGAAIGVIRFPDFYTRMHAAGKADTLSSILVLSGLALYNLNDFSWPAVLVSLKIVAIVAFIFITSPTSTHALMQSGYEAGIKPWKPQDDEDEDNPEAN